MASKKTAYSHAYPFGGMLSALLLLAPLSACAWLGEPLITAPNSDLKEYEAAAFSFGTIGLRESAPVGYFLIMRKNMDACAIRFTGFKRSGKQTSASLFYSGEPTTYAEYDWLYQSDGSLDFTKPNVTAGHGYVKNTASFGIGRLAFKPTAKQFVKCGPFSPAWLYPNALSPSQQWRDGRWMPDFEIEAAPTKRKAQQELVLDSVKLGWSRYGMTSIERIPLEELP